MCLMTHPPVQEDSRERRNSQTDIDILKVHFKPIMDEVMIVKLRIDLGF